MSLDLELSYGEVAFKASHNSYDRSELPVSLQLEALGNAASDGRCRGLELDLNLSGRNWLWSVNHLGGYGGAADQQLTAYLDDLARWHRSNGDHDVITITLDLKGDTPLDKSSGQTSRLAAALDTVLESAFAEAIYRPRDLRGNNDTLLEGAANWPSLKALRGKFIFFLSGNGDLKDAYTAGGGKSAVCFVDKKLSPGDAFTPENTPEIVFYNIDVDAWSQPNGSAKLKQTVTKIAEDGRCIVRGYVVNNPQIWSSARSAGFSILTTDKVRHCDWATVGDEPFMPRLPQTRSMPTRNQSRVPVTRATKTTATRRGLARRK
jgi:hypothetical protein